MGWKERPAVCPDWSLGMYCTSIENQGPMVDGMVWHGQIIYIVFSSETSSHSHPFFRGIWQDSVHELCRLQARNLGDLRSARSLP